MRSVYLISLLMLIGCKGGVLKLGAGAETDARLTADVYTWGCSAEDVDWMGAFGFDVSLVYTPDQLASRELPAVNECALGVSMFSLDTLEGGTDIPDADAPKWATSNDFGRLERQLAGLYHDDVFKNVFSCDPVDTVVASGVEITEAGRLSGVRTPEAGNIYSVTSSVDATGGLPFGEPIDLAWDVEGWDESFIQIRRARGGALVETLTCNTTGSSSFLIDGSVWGELNSNLMADTNYLYVGFRNVGNQQSPEGQKVDVETRGLHVVGLTDL